MDTMFDDTSGIWKHSKLILSVLALLFIASISADVVLWYSMQKRNTAIESLNEVIANQPPAPKTDEDKTKLLDSLAAAHAAAVAQATAQPKTKAASTSAQSSVQAKINILNSLTKKTQ